MTRTVAGAEQWARQNVTTAGGGGFYNGYNWSGMCQALMFRACGLSDSADTAYQAYRASGARNTDYSAAPRGAFHWWADHGDPDPGHVALDLDGGGTRCLMASSQLSGGQDFAPGGYCIGTQAVPTYNSLSGLIYLGWTLDNVGSRMSDVGTPGPGNNPGPAPYALTVADQKVLQTLAQRGGYTGPVDGAMGVNSWKGVQTAVKGYGYTGPIDGVPGTNTYRAIQSLAQDGGYTGPVDGVLGPNTIRGVSAWLVSHPPSTPPGPGPAPNPPAGSAIYGLDVGTSQANLDFLAARSAGYRFCVVKSGGSNDGTHQPYTSPYYVRQVDAARAAGLLVGHYWMSGWGTAAGDAAYYLAHLHDYRAGDPLMIDVEGIDGSPVWTDAQTAAFITAVKSALGATPFLYTYSSLLRSKTWTQTQATGAKLWIAHYDVAPGSPEIGTAYPTWAIHQFSSSGSIRGVTVDVNYAKPDAFGSATLPPPGPNPVPDPVPDIPLADGVTVQRVAQLGGYVGPIDGVLGVNSWKGVQTLLKQLGLYTGVIDGIPGANTYRGLQQLAQRGGYTGPIDGVPGPNTYAGLRGYLAQTGGAVTISTADAKTLQQLGQRGGYTGPVDGVLGVNSWRGVQTVLSQGYYTGPLDGVPGPNTYTGLQRLAADYGYTGPIDGSPGPNTFAGIRSYLSVTSGGPGPISTADGTVLQKIGKAGGYTGPIDGVMGVNSWKGVQTVVRGYGYAGPLDGAPGANTYRALQTLATAGGYTGPIDGVMGVNSWKGVQTVLRRFGYTGPIDGVPGTATYAAMQRMAKLGGYTGPADGVLGSFSWRGLQACFRGWDYAGLIDGVPGAGTYTAVQRLAQTSGYTGPIDGVPGPNTYRALANLVA
ncbi:GH25 family lysozyme [Allocatelliglobosispora scoriae]|uniref:GH25 family lysozyme n=1 Tax=Allocatelliglobosispora scoriae TaxID=643052 RepID=UPI00160FBC04|nr:GH25 family lysozyme [Allocatelliglobosispora scoriae]